MASPARARLTRDWSAYTERSESDAFGKTLYSNIADLDDALASLDLRLSPEEIAKLEAPYVPHPVSGFN